MKFEYNNYGTYKKCQKEFKESLDLSTIPGIDLNTVCVSICTNGREGVSRVPFFIHFESGGKAELRVSGSLKGRSYLLSCMRKIKGGTFTLDREEYTDISKREDGTIEITFDDNQSAKFWSFKV